tara:strand:- start:2041 stop:2820 length:780 start_codon:yes stop_codon:yes gene_type:complete
MGLVSDIWPYSVTAMNDKGRTTFAKKELTIDRVFDKYGIGYTFEEDTQDPSAIWNMQGEWDDTANNGRGGRLDYTGDRYDEGDTVEAVLVHRTYKKRDGTDGEARDVKWIRKLATPSVQQPRGEDPESAVTPDVTPVTKRDKWEIKDETIRRGQAVNVLMELAKQVPLLEATLGKEFPIAAVLRHEIGRLANSEPVDLSYFQGLIDKTGLPNIADLLVDEGLEEKAEEYESSDVDYGDAADDIQVNEDGEQVETLKWED